MMMDNLSDSEWLLISICESSFEHPAGGYKKIFQTVEETGEALPATVVGKPITVKGNEKKKNMQTMFISI